MMGEGTLLNKKHGKWIFCLSQQILVKARFVGFRRWIFFKTTMKRVQTAVVWPPANNQHNSKRWARSGIIDDEKRGEFEGELIAKFEPAFTFL